MYCFDLFFQTSRNGIHNSTDKSPEIKHDHETVQSIQDPVPEIQNSPHEEGTKIPPLVDKPEEISSSEDPTVASDKLIPSLLEPETLPCTDKSIDEQLLDNILTPSE